MVLGVGWTIAFARLAVAVFFLLFGEYKLVGASSHAWVTAEFPKYLHGYVAGGEAVGAYRAFLEAFVVPHASVWAYAVGIGEAAIGAALALGIAVRAASIGGMLHMANLALATWWAPGHGVDVWRYVGAELDHLSLFLLFAIFAASGAVDPLRLDRRRRAR